MPVSMRAPDGRGFMRERVRRVSGEDIRGDARARSPHGLCGRACTAGGSHEADTCVGVEVWFVVRASYVVVGWGGTPRLTPN